MPGSVPAIVLRLPIISDISAYYEFHCDTQARAQSGAGQAELQGWDKFLEKWKKIFADETIFTRTVECQGQVAGHVVSFIAPWSGDREIGYWIGRSCWGQGIATCAVAEFLRLVPTRPLFGRAVVSNIASRRVLEKCGFAFCGIERGRVNADGVQLEDALYRLDNATDALFS